MRATNNEQCTYVECRKCQLTLFGSMICSSSTREKRRLLSESTKHFFRTHNCRRWLQKCNNFALLSWLIFFIGRHSHTKNCLISLAVRCVFFFPFHLAYTYSQFAAIISCSAKIFSHINNSICVVYFIFFLLRSNGIWKPLHVLQFNSYTCNQRAIFDIPFAFNKLQCTDFFFCSLSSVTFNLLVDTCNGLVSALLRTNSPYEKLLNLFFVGPQIIK